MIRESREQLRAGWTASGIVEAPVETVWQIMLEMNPLLTEDDQRTINHSGKQLFATTTGKHLEGKVTIEVDASQHSIAVQGEWWYRGIHAVEPHARGSLVIYRVYNVAPGLSRWMVPLMQRPFKHQMRDQLRLLIDEIGKQLGCKTDFIANS